jgi:hypothetical protein
MPSWPPTSRPEESLRSPRTVSNLLQMRQKLVSLKGHFFDFAP